MPASPLQVGLQPLPEQCAGLQVGAPGPLLLLVQIPGYVVGTWTVDPTHSDVSFTVRHMMLSKVRGHFERFSGEIVTAENPVESTVVAVVDATSLNTSNVTVTTMSTPPTFSGSTSTRPSSFAPPGCGPTDATSTSSKET
jgi:YceI-like domain